MSSLDSNIVFCLARYNRVPLSPLQINESSYSLHSVSLKVQCVRFIVVVRKRMTKN